MRPGISGSIQLSLRIFTGFVEVDVLFNEGAQPGAAVQIGPQADSRQLGAAPVTDPPTAYPVPAGVVVTSTTSNGAIADLSVSAPLTFAKWLSGALRREGLTMEAAARRLDVSAKTVSRWVGGATEPRLRDLARIRDVFGDPPFP